MDLLSLISLWLDIICQVTTKRATVPKPTNFHHSTCCGLLNPVSIWKFQFHVQFLSWVNFTSSLSLVSLGSGQMPIVSASLPANTNQPRTGLWPSGKLPVVGGSRRGFEPPHRTCWDFPGFSSGGVSRVYGPQWDDMPVTLHLAGVVCVYRL